MNLYLVRFQFGKTPDLNTPPPFEFGVIENNQMVSTSSLKFTRAYEEEKQSACINLGVLLIISIAMPFALDDYYGTHSIMIWVIHGVFNQTY